MLIMKVDIICGKNNIITTENFASIMIGKDLDSVRLGTQIPAGIIM